MISPPTLAMPLVPGKHNKEQWWARLSTDFDMAQSKSQWKRFWDLLLFRSGKLMAFEDAMRGRRLRGQSDLTMRIVPIAEITGSVGRQHDFDRHFLPRHEHLKQRWQTIDQAYYTGKVLPPVELQQLDGRYYVVDGHHRISVARFHGQQYIEAHVIQIYTEAIHQPVREFLETACVGCA